MVSKKACAANESNHPVAPPEVADFLQIAANMVVVGVTRLVEARISAVQADGVAEQIQAVDVDPRTADVERGVVAQ